MPTGAIGDGKVFVSDMGQAVRIGSGVVGGWTREMGVLDFAGGIVVHINAGVAALVICVVLGKRTGYPTTPMPPNSLVLTVIGASMLWVGWFGFNAGSQLAADGVAGMAFMARDADFCHGVFLSRRSFWMIIECFIAQPYGQIAFELFEATELLNTGRLAQASPPSRQHSGLVDRADWRQRVHDGLVRAGTFQTHAGLSLGLVGQWQADVVYTQYMSPNDTMCSACHGARLEIRLRR